MGLNTQMPPKLSVALTLFSQERKVGQCHLQPMAVGIMVDVCMKFHYVPPAHHLPKGGHTVFGTDPVGVGVCIKLHPL